MSDTTTLTRLKQLMDAAHAPQLGPGSRPGTLPLSPLNAALDPVLNAGGITGPRAGLIRALVLLWHDHLEASHQLAQGIETTDGSYVHGIMHRREPDYGNAKYWFRRVGDHPGFVDLAAKAKPLLDRSRPNDIAAQLLRGNQWDPVAFIDACERAAALPGDSVFGQTLRAIQAIEFELLLERFART